MLRILLLFICISGAKVVNWNTTSGSWSRAQNWENNTIPGALDTAEFRNEHGSEIRILIRNDVNVTKIYSIGKVLFWIKGETKVVAKHFQVWYSSQWSIFEDAKLDTTEIQDFPVQHIGSLNVVGGTFIGHGQQLGFDRVELISGTLIGMSNFSLTNIYSSITVGQQNSSIFYVDGVVTIPSIFSFRWYLGSEIVVRDSLVFKNQPEIKIIGKVEEGEYPLIRCSRTTKRCPKIEDFTLTFEDDFEYELMGTYGSSISVKITKGGEINLIIIIIPTMIGLLGFLLIIYLIAKCQNKKNTEGKNTV